MVTKMTKPILDEDEYALLLPEEDFHSEMLSNDGSKTNSHSGISENNEQWITLCSNEVFVVFKIAACKKKFSIIFS